MGRIEPPETDRDERLGEAIEGYLELAESGDPPDPEDYASRYPDLSDELREALEGLAVVQGLVGSGGGAAGSPLRSGGRLAGYQIVRELGRGGMGVVYEAVHLDLDRPVALKVLGPQHAPDSSGRRRFLNEAKTAAGLHHTYIVPVFDVGQVGGLCYYAMQRIEGCGLDRIVRRLRRGRTDDGTAAGGTSTAGHAAVTASWHEADAPPLAAAPPPESAPVFEPPPGSAYYLWAARVGQQAAEALEYAHRRRVVHRDIKPSNLLVDRRGTVWVADFGLARREADPGLTQPGSPLGTPRYMSPEQATDSPVDARTDVFSLGATLYELLALRPAFDGAGTAELIRQITAEEPTSPRKLEPRVPRDLETIVLKAMAKRPGDRYARAQDLAEDLARFQAGLPVRARRISPIGRFHRFARRHPFSSTISVAAATIVLAVATWAHWTVLQQRNEAQRARDAAQAALVETNKAIRRSEEARARQLGSEASLIRRSSLPNSRSEGLARLREAAALVGADSDLRVGLRDEAIELFGLRDLEAGSSFESGRTWGLAFAAGGNVLATLDDAGSELTLLDPRTPASPRRVRLAGDPRSMIEPPLRFPPRDGPRFGTGVVAAGPWLAVIEPDQTGVALLVPETGSRFSELAMPDRIVESVIATTDGRRLVTIDRPRGALGPGFTAPRLRATLWDPGRPEGPIATLADPDESDEEDSDRPTRRRPWWQIPLIAAAPDGRTLAVAWLRLGGDPEDPPDPVLLFDSESGKPIGKIRDMPGHATALALGPGDLLAAAISDGTVRFWEGTKPSPLLGLYHQQPWVGTLKFNPDGTLLALAGPGSGVEFWEPATNALVATARTPERVGDIAFGPDGRTVATASGETTRLWSILEPVGRDRLSGFESRPTALGFDDDGEQLAVTSWNAPLRLWKVGRSACSAPVPCLEPAVNASWANAGRLVVVVAEGLELHHLDTPEPIRRITWDQFADDDDSRRNRSGGRSPEARSQQPFWVSLARTADGSAIIVGRRDRLYLWRNFETELPRVIRLPAQTAADLETGPRRGRSPWYNLALGDAGRRLYATNMDGMLHAWDLVDTGAEVEARPLRWSGVSSGIRVIAASGRGDALVAIDARGRARLLDVETGQFSDSIELTGDRATAVAFTPDGSTLAIGLQEGGLAVLRRGTHGGYQRLIDLPGHRGAVGILAFDPTGRRLASAGDDKAAQVWDLDRVAAELAALRLGW